jgi:hypothetical protein
MADRPHPARLYDYFLGGHAHYAVDRAAAKEVLDLFPTARAAARANRSFMHRAVRYLTRKGIRQFLDIGAGLPMAPNVHEVAQQTAADSRVLYVDTDPLVLTYADAFLDSAPGGPSRCIRGDVRRPEVLLRTARASGFLNWQEPVALLMHGLLHLLPDPCEPHGILTELLSALPAGSALSLTHCTADFDPRTWAALSAVHDKDSTVLQPRAEADVARFFDGLHLADPGLVPVHRWQPDPGETASVNADAEHALYAGLAIKP